MTLSRLGRITVWGFRIAKTRKQGEVCKILIAILESLDRFNGVG